MPRAEAQVWGGQADDPRGRPKQVAADDMLPIKNHQPGRVDCRCVVL